MLLCLLILVPSQISAEGFTCVGADCNFNSSRGAVSISPTNTQPYESDAMRHYVRESKRRELAEHLLKLQIIAEARRAEEEDARIRSIVRKEIDASEAPLSRRSCTTNLNQNGSGYIQLTCD